MPVVTVVTVVLVVVVLVGDFVAVAVLSVMVVVPARSRFHSSPGCCCSDDDHEANDGDDRADSVAPGLLVRRLGTV